MKEPKEQFEQLLQHLECQTGHTFPIHNNACTLVDGHQEVAVVIELPENSNLLVLHRMLSTLPSEIDKRNGLALQLLALNSQPDRLKGAWFCIDPDGFGVHLMSGTPIDCLTANDFENLLFNYIELADTLTQELKDEAQELNPKHIPNPNGIQP